VTTSVTSWLDSLSAIELALVCCAFFVSVTLVGVVLIHPLMRRLIHAERQANDVVIFVAANYGLIFAVLLGLLTVATFQTTKDLQDHVADEASKPVNDVSQRRRLSGASAQPTQIGAARLHPLCDRERLAGPPPGRTPQGGEHRLQAIREALFSFEPKSKTQEVLHGEVIRQFNAMSVSREERLSAVSSSMPAVLWYVVIFGGMLTIVFLWLIHMDFIPQVVLGVLTAVFIGLMTFLIFAMDRPLQGAVSVGPEPFQSVYDLVMKWDESS
jgi:hypothetical protein